jgi:hypothetical protein
MNKFILLSSVMVITCLLGTISIVHVVFGTKDNLIPGIDLSFEQSENGITIDCSCFDYVFQYIVP